jgi:ADP-ribose pyrophosphatase YjhB (NUDIX family)
MSTEVREAFPEFDKPSVAIDTVILRTNNLGEYTDRQIPLKQLQVLLIKKHSEDMWYLPGTMLRLGEVPEEAINRIVTNKAGNNETTFEQLYTVADNPLRDERGHIISIVYIGMTNNKCLFDANSDYGMEWFWVSKADQSGKRTFTSYKYGTLDDLKYDHSKIVDNTIERLQGKLMYSDIAFNFVDEVFTIRELENTFTAINERDIPGFRRIIANKIEETGTISDGKAFRPAKLYRKKR